MVGFAEAFLVELFWSLLVGVVVVTVVLRWFGLRVFWLTLTNWCLVCT